MNVAFLPVIGFAIVGFALVAVLVVVGLRRERARQDALDAWAAAGGWARVARDQRWVGAFAGPPFGTGDDRRADDVCSRLLDGRQQVAFTYRYATYETVTRTDANGASHTERERRDHTFAVLAVQLPAVLGPLAITREGLMDRVARAFGGQDIEIEHADFNRRYRVTAAEPKHAVDLLNPRTVERLLGHADASVRLADGWAVLWDVGALEPAFVDERLSVVADLLAGVPRFVWQDRGFEPTDAPQDS